MTPNNNYLRNSWMVPNHDEETRSKFRNTKIRFLEVGISEGLEVGDGSP